MRCVAWWFPVQIQNWRHATVAADIWNRIQPFGVIILPSCDCVYTLSIPAAVWHERAAEIEPTHYGCWVWMLSIIFMIIDVSNTVSCFFFSWQMLVMSLYRRTVKKSAFGIHMVLICSIFRVWVFETPRGSEVFGSEFSRHQRVWVFETPGGLSF